jgi:hypothetical protein
MKSTYATWIVAAACWMALMAAANESAADQDVAGVWYGTYKAQSNDYSSGFGGSFNPTRTDLTFYRLELEVNGDEVVGTMVVGRKVDTRSRRDKAMAGLGLPAPQAPALPPEYSIVGTVGGQDLALEALMPRVTPKTITASVKGDRMRAEVTTGPITQFLRLDRCEPSSDAAEESCSAEALWRSYLDVSSHRRGERPIPGISALRAAESDARLPEMRDE